MAGATDDFQSCMYVIRKEVAADKEVERMQGDDLSQKSSEVCLPLGSELWERLSSSIQKVRGASEEASRQAQTNKASDFLGGSSSMMSRLTGRSPRKNTTAAKFESRANLAVFLLTAGDELMKLGETTAAQELCYAPVAQIAEEQASRIQLRSGKDAEGQGKNNERQNESGDPQFTLKLSPTSQFDSQAGSPSDNQSTDNDITRLAIVMHARSVFGAARAMAARVANRNNAFGGKESPGVGDPQLRFELSIRNIVKHLDAVSQAISWILLEQKRSLASHFEVKNSGAVSKSTGDAKTMEAQTTSPDTMEGSQSSASLYWLLQNGASTLYSLADPLVVAGHGMHVKSYLAWAVMAVETCLELCTTKFLGWRVSLYRTLASAYIGAGEWEAAENAALRAEKAVAQLREDESMDPPIPSGVEKVLLRAHGDVRCMLLRIRVWKMLRDAEVRANTMGASSDHETVEAIVEALETTEGLLGGTGVESPEDNAQGEAGNTFFKYLGETSAVGADTMRGYGPESDSQRRLRLAVDSLCECAEQTVFDDGDDDDSNDNSCIDVLARTACLVAAITRAEPILSRIESGGALFPAVDEKKKRRKKGEEKTPPPALSLATHSNLARQAFELGQWHHCARLLYTLLLRCGAIKKDTSDEDEANADAEVRVTFTEHLQMQNEEQVGREDAEEISAAIEAAVVEARAAREAISNMAANQHKTEVFTLFPGDAPDDAEATASLMLDVSEWVAEARLLDTMLQLEHPQEHENAREVLDNTQDADDTGSHNGQVDEPSSSKVDNEAALTKRKPKPVVFDIGGQRFRVDTLKDVAAALIVATTEASLLTPGGGLPFTRREVLMKIALGLWSPYAEAMLSELEEFDEDESPDPRLIDVTLTCVDAVFIALTALDSGDMIFRSKVGLQVALLHELAAESSGDLAGGQGAQHLRSGVQAARKMLQMILDERQRNVDLGWHLAGDIPSQHMENNRTNSSKLRDVEEKSESGTSLAIDTKDPFTTHTSFSILTRAAISATSRGDGNTYGSAVVFGVHPRNRLAQLDAYLSDLAAIHTDLVLAVTRLTMLQGASEHASHQKHDQISAAKRNRNSHGHNQDSTIMGAASVGMGNELGADLLPSKFLTSNPNTESYLASEAGFDGYVRAMQLICIASRYRARSSDRVKLFEEAFSKLKQCKKDEDELCALAKAAEEESMNPHPKCMQVLPLPPVLVSRSTSSVTLRLTPFWRMEKSTYTEVHPSSSKGSAGGGGHGGATKKSSARKDDKLGTLLPVAYFKVFGKPLGAGTSVSLNNTEYFGLGTEIPARVTGKAVASDPTIPGGGGTTSSMGSSESPKKKMVGGMSPRAAAMAASSLVCYEPSDMGDGQGVPTVTVKGLLAGEAYVFAVAAYASDGSLIGNSIGPTSKVPFVCAVPLPVPLCMSYLATAAANSGGCASISKIAAETVYNEFVEYHKDKNEDDPFGMPNLHVRNPARAHSLIRSVVERSPLPVLQAFVRSVFTYLDMMAAQEEAAASSNKNSSVGGGKQLDPFEGGSAGIIPTLSRPLLPFQVTRLQYLQRAICAVEAARLATIAPPPGSVLTKNIDPRRPAAGADLVMEGVVRSYNLAEPLLRVSELGPHLLRSFIVLRKAMYAVPRHQWYPVCQRLFARLAYEITRIGELIGEAGVIETALIGPSTAEEKASLGGDDHEESSSVALQISHGEPVKEQKAIETSFIISKPDFFKSGNKVMHEVAGLPHTIDNGSSGGDEGDSDIDTAIFGIVHGEKETESEDQLLERRLSIAYEKLCNPEIFGKTHARFLEILCKLARIGLERGAHKLIRSWLFKSVGNDDSNPEKGIDEVSIAFELASRLKDERARGRRAKERADKRAMLREKRNARIIALKASEKDAARETAIAAGEEWNDEEDDTLTAEELDSYEFADENDSIAYPKELAEEELLQEEEDDKAAVLAEELPKLLSMDEYVQTCLCKEIVEVPDSQAVLASAIKAIREDYTREQELRRLADDAKIAANEAAIVAAEAAEAAALAAASGGQDEDKDMDEDGDEDGSPTPADIADQAKKRADELKLAADEAAAVAENTAPSTGLEKLFDGRNRTDSNSMSDPPPNMPNAVAQTQLLWLSQLQLLRARVLFEWLAQDGTHAEEPLMDFPSPFRVATSNSEAVNTAMRDSIESDPNSTIKSSAARSTGPLMDLCVVLPPDEQLDEKTGDALVPKNPSCTIIRRAARNFIDVEELRKKEQRQLQRQREKAAAEAAEAAEAAGEDPEAAADAVLNQIPSLPLKNTINSTIGFSTNIAASYDIGENIPMSARQMSVAVEKRRRHRERRLLIREILLLCSRAARRAAFGKHWSISQQCLKIFWNTLWLGWVCPLDFSSKQIGEALWHEALILGKKDWKRDDVIRRKKEHAERVKDETSDVGSTPPNSRPSTAAVTSRRSLSKILEYDYFSTESPVELSWQPLCHASHTLLDCVEAVQGNQDTRTMNGNNDPNDSFPTPPIDTTWIAQFVIFTMSALTNLDERPALLLLGRRLLNLTDNSSSVAERALPLMLYAQQQTWRRLEAKVSMEKARLDRHDAVWKKSEEARAKKRKRRLLTVGMRPEEKAYRNIRARLSSKLDGWQTLERREGEIYQELKTRLENLLRDKSNSLESLDSAKRKLYSFLDGRFGLGGLRISDDASNSGSTSKNAGESTQRSSRSKMSRSSRVQRTSRSRSIAGSSAAGGSKSGGASGTSTSGRSSKSGKYELEYGEPLWVKQILKQFDKVISGLRSKRETHLLVEALDALGDFQATRGAGNVGRAAGLISRGPAEIGVPGASGEIIDTKLLKAAHNGQLLAIAAVPNPRRRQDALKAWLDAVDASFGAVDVDRAWRSFTDDFSSSISTGTFTKCKLLNDVNLLSKLGLWQCLRCGMIAAKAAQFCLQNEPGRQVDLCLFSARVLSAPFASSLPHPVRPCDFASRAYLVNERNRRTVSGGEAGRAAVLKGERTDDANRANNDETDYVWPGIQGLHFGLHRQAPDPLQLLICIRFVCGNLIKAGGLVGSGDGSSFGLACLAPLALAEHAAISVGSIKHAFEVRMMRVGALRLCNRFKEASSELAALLRGDRLPGDMSAKSDPEPVEDSVVVVGQESSDNGDNDAEPGTESITNILTSAVACRPGKGIGLPSPLDADENDADLPESTTGTARSKGMTARSTARSVQSGAGDTGRSGVSMKIPRNMRPTTATFNEGPRIEADPFELAADDPLAVHSQLPLLQNDLHVTHSSQAACLKWMMDIDRVRCPRRLRKLVGRGLVRRLQVERCKLLLHFARSQGDTHKTTELVSDEDVISLHDILDCVDEFACRLKHGCLDGTALATWVRPAPPPPPPTPPETARSQVSAKNSARSNKSTARSSDNEEHDSFPLNQEAFDLPELPPVYVFQRAERRLNRIETHLMFNAIVLRVECALAKRMFGKAVLLAQELQQALANDANARMNDVKEAQELAEKARRAAVQEERLFKDTRPSAAIKGAGGLRTIDPPGFMNSLDSSLGQEKKSSVIMDAIAEDGESPESQSNGISSGTGDLQNPPQRHRPRVTVIIPGNRPANVDEERDPLLRPGLGLWLRSRALRAVALLSIGDLDGAKDECDAGLADARNSVLASSDPNAAQEKLVSAHLGCMRAQIHTASGETEEALGVLQLTEKLLSVDTKKDDEISVGESHSAGHSDGDGLGEIATPPQTSVLQTRDAFSPNPNGLIECLCLRGDLLIEISQAEDREQQRMLQDEAMICFKRAVLLSKLVLDRCGWDDQAGAGGTLGRGEVEKYLGGGYKEFSRGPMACIYFPAVVLLAKSQLRVAKTMALVAQGTERKAAEEIAEDVLEAIAEAHTSLTGHVCSQPPTLLPTVMLFHGRFLRLSLPRRVKSLSVAQFSANISKIQPGSRNYCGTQIFDSVVSALEDTLKLSLQAGGHDHLLIRAVLLELTALFGSRWVKSDDYDWEARHKRAASFYLRKAAEAATMYQRLRSEVQDIGSGDQIPVEELTSSVPPSVLRYLVEQQCNRTEANESLVDDAEGNASSKELKTDENSSRPTSAVDSEAAAMAYRPETYASPRDSESQKDEEELASCEISMRSILYYYLELLQQRRICEAGINNDARAQSIVDIHNFLVEKAPAYKEKCCFLQPPIFAEPLPAGNADGNGDPVTEETADVVSESLKLFFYRSLNLCCIIMALYFNAYLTAN